MQTEPSSKGPRSERFPSALSLAFCLALCRLYIPRLTRQRVARAPSLQLLRNRNEILTIVSIHLAAHLLIANCGGTFETHHGCTNQMSLQPPLLDRRTVHGPLKSGLAVPVTSMLRSVLSIANTHHQLQARYRNVLSIDQVPSCLSRSSCTRTDHAKEIVLAEVGQFLALATKRVLACYGVLTWPGVGARRLRGRRDGTILVLQVLVGGRLRSSNSIEELDDCGKGSKAVGASE